MQTHWSVGGSAGGGGGGNGGFNDLVQKGYASACAMV